MEGLNERRNDGPMATNSIGFPAPGPLWYLGPWVDEPISRPLEWVCGTEGDHLDSTMPGYLS